MHKSFQNPSFLCSVYYVLISYCFIKEVFVITIKKKKKPVQKSTTAELFILFLFHSTVNTYGILLCLLIKYLCSSGNCTLMTVRHSSVVSVLPLLKNYSFDSQWHSSLDTTDVICFPQTSPMGTAANFQTEGA